MLYDLLQSLDFRKINFQLCDIPSIEDRGFWENYPIGPKTAILKDAENHINYAWPSLLYTHWREFEISGSRKAYEEVYCDREKILQSLIFAECFENKGRFLDDISNGIILFCEQTTWGFSAHRYPRATGLVDPEDPYLEIHVARIGIILALALHFLGDKLELSIRERIDYELKRRIVKPFLKHDDYWWEAFPRFKGERRLINNWAIRICKNIMTVILIADIEKKQFYDCVDKLVRITDIFIDYYPDDGACDEGADYWAASAGVLIELLDMLYRYSGGKINYFDNEKIKRMCHYFANAYISADYVVNFSDCSPRTGGIGYYQFLCGKLMKDNDLCIIGKQFTEKWVKQENNLLFAYDSYVAVRYGMMAKEILEYENEKNLSDIVYLPNTQFLKVRRKDDTGLLLASKGGNNDEGHNHNDIGCLIVYSDKEPAIVDPGNVRYTRQSFDPNERYKIWAMQSKWHSLPVINGYMQSAGKQYMADNVIFDEENTTFSLDIEKAYSVDTKLEKYNRTISFDRENNVIGLTDKFDFTETDNKIIENFTLVDKPVVTDNSAELLLPNSTKVVLKWNSDIKPAVKFEENDFSDDEWAFSSWRHNLYCLSIEFEAGKTAEFKCEIIQE